MKYLCLLFASLIAVFSQPAQYTVQPPKIPQTVISGHGWAYTFPFIVHDSSTIEKLIQCESKGVNLSRPDSDGLISDGILQFHRGSARHPSKQYMGIIFKGEWIVRKPDLPKRGHQDD